MMDETNGFTLKETTDTFSGCRVKRFFYSTGEIYMETYSRVSSEHSVCLHRDSAPAVRTWFRSGVLKSEEYFRNGVPNRLGGDPIRIVYNFRGQIRSLTWSENSPQARLGGPINVKFAGGSLIEMTWPPEKYVNGVYVRTWSEGKFSWIIVDSGIKAKINPHFMYSNVAKRLNVTGFK